MAKGRVLLAALAGLVVSFLVFASLTMLTPDPDLHRGEGEVVWQRFQFQQGEYEFTRMSVAVVVNQGPVPVNLVATGPNGGNVSFVLPTNGTAEIDLDEQGVYRLTAQTYGWGEAQIIVRSENPFVRFFENVF